MSCKFVCSPQEGSVGFVNKKELIPSGTLMVKMLNIVVQVMRQDILNLYYNFRLFKNDQFKQKQFHFKIYQ